MSRGKVPEDAFDYYVGLGPVRSYRAVAEHYGISKRTVVTHATAEKWSERLAKIQADARAEGDKRLADAMVEMHERHLSMIKAMSTRAMIALKEHPIDSGMDAIRASDMVIKLERLIMGEPSERSEVSIEEVTKREMERWLVWGKDDDPAVDGDRDGEDRGGDEDDGAAGPVPAAR